MRPARARAPLIPNAISRVPDRIRVRLDVSQFGVVQERFHETLHRTGIHRVIQQTIRSVRTVPGVELSLCAPEWTEAALVFVDADDTLRDLPFVPPRLQLAHRLRSRVLDDHARLGVHPPGSLRRRVANRLMRDVNVALDPRNASAGRRARLARQLAARLPGRLTAGPDADVFHSPLYKLPAPEARRPGVRYVLTVYDLVPFVLRGFSSWGGEAFLDGVLGSLGPDDHVIAISEHTRRDLLEARPDIAPERVHVTHLAADRDRFYRCDDAARVAAARARYGIPDAPYVLSVGTLEPRKNIAHLIRTFAAVVRAERLDDLHLVLTGTRGWDDVTIFAAAGEFGDLRDRIVFTDYVDDADLAPLYSGALVFVYPTLYEGFGLPPLEAMQCGTPVITSNTSSLPEVVGDAAITIDPRDADALAQALLDLYRDPARRAELTTRGLARARAFSWQRFGEETVAAYRAAR